MSENSSIEWTDHTWEYGVGDVIRDMKADASDPMRWMRRMGKTAAGRLLDGREWNGAPCT